MRRPVGTGRSIKGEGTPPCSQWRSVFGCYGPAASPAVTSSIQPAWCEMRTA